MGIYRRTYPDPRENHQSFMLWGSTGYNCHDLWGTFLFLTKIILEHQTTMSCSCHEQWSQCCFLLALDEINLLRLHRFAYRLVAWLHLSWRGTSSQAWKKTMPRVIEKPHNTRSFSTSRSAQRKNEEVCPDAESYIKHDRLRKLRISWRDRSEI